MPTPTATSGAPVAAFILSPSQGRPPLNVSFTDRSTGLPAVWRWDFGDGGTSTSRNPYHVYATEGLKIVNLTINNTFGANTTTGYVTVGSAPFAAFSAEPRTVGAGKPVAFTDRSIGTPTGWSWAFGDGGTSSARNPSHTYSQSGLYTVRMTATYTGSSDTEQKTDYIRVVPDANFTANATAGKTPLAVRFTDVSNGTPNAWSWEFGDGTNATGQNPTHVYARSGNYTVNLTARNGYGSTTLSRAGLARVEPSRPLLTLPGGTAMPKDLNGDGLYEDANGNGRKDFADVVLYFNQMTWIAANEPVEALRLQRQRPDRLRRRRLALQPPLRGTLLLFPYRPVRRASSAIDGDAEGSRPRIQRPKTFRFESIAMRYIALIAALAFLVLAAGCTAPSGPQAGTSTPAATVTTVHATAPAVSIAAGSARVASVGGNATVPIVLASAPNGISGYNITVALTDPSVAEITAVAFPDWAAMKSSSAVPSGKVVLQAVDMSIQVPVGATNVTLATLTVKGKAAGSTAITVTPDPGLGVQDRSGDLYAVTAVPGTLTVGA